MADVPEVTVKRSALAAALLVGPLAILAQGWLALSSFPLLSGELGRTMGWLVPGFLAGWAAPRGRRLLAISVTAILLILLIVPRTAYDYPFFLAAVPALTLLAGAAGVALARVRPVPPVRVLLATLAFTLCVGGWLVGRDKVATVLLSSTPLERGRDEHRLLFIPQPYDRASALIAIGGREAAAGHPTAAERHFEDALRTEPELPDRKAVAEAVAEAQTQAGFVPEARATLAGVYPDAQQVSWTLGNDLVRARRFPEADAEADHLTAQRRVELLRNLAVAEGEARHPELARATIAKLDLLADEQSSAARLLARRDILTTLVKSNLEDEALGRFRSEEPEYLAQVAEAWQCQGRPELAVRLRALLGDGGPR